MKIQIKDYAIDLIIGIFDYERTTKQTVHFDIDIYLDEECGKHDKIDDTLDYFELLDKLTTHLKNSQYQLLESLVNDVAHFILDNKFVHRVNVAADKGKIFNNVEKVVVSTDLSKENLILGE